MIPQNLDELLTLNRAGLAALDIPAAIALAQGQADEEDAYSAYLAILVALSTKTKAGAEYRKSDLNFLPYAATLAREGNLEHVIYKHPSRNHCIMTDWRDGIYQGFGTLEYDYAMECVFGDS